MKKVYLVRHAKSDWSVPELADIDRPLNQRGYRDAHRMGEELKTKVAESFLMISSPAIRAISTALIIARRIDHDPEKIIIEKDLYEAEEKKYLQLIENADDKYNSLLIFGHNPTISNVFAMLTETDARDLPTCSVSIIEIDSNSWIRSLGVKKTAANQIFPSHFKDNT